MWLDSNEVVTVPIRAFFGTVVITLIRALHVYTAQIHTRVVRKKVKRSTIIFIISECSAVCLIQTLLIQKCCQFTHVIMVPAEPIALHYTLYLRQIHN